MSTFPQRFIGQTGFDSEPIDINRVIRRSAEDLVVEFSTEGWLYTVNMSSRDGIHYSGEYSARKGGDNDRGRTQASLYSAGQHQLLFGKWIENGTRYWWWLRLEPVDSFE